MRILGKYSFAGGAEYSQQKYPALLREIEEAIGWIDAAKALVKESRERTMPGRLLYSPVALNDAFEDALGPRGWRHVKEYCTYLSRYYTSDYHPKVPSSRPFRDMDFVKESLGVEVQFGKYSFMVYNVCAKMTIFRNLGHIDAGVEIVPVREFAQQMSTGVSYFEQFVWDLETRGVSDIDVPVLILGIGS